MLLPDYHTRNSKWLHIPIEILHRELVSKLLLACVAAENGYSVIIGEQSKMRRKQSQLPKGVFFEKGCGNSDVIVDLFKAYKKSGHKIVVSDEESPSIYSLPDYWCNARISQESFDLCDKYLVWGEKQAEILQDYLEIEPDKMIVTGSHRIDVWSPPICNLHQDAADKIRAKYGPYILMPSNFSGELHARGPEFQIKQAVGYGFISSDAEKTNYRNMIKYKASVVEKFVDVFALISIKFPKHNLIVRPHPTEDNTYWERATRNIPRCSVTYEGEIAPWMLGADAIFHNGCTSALEAKLMNLVPITYMPVTNKRYDDSFLCNCGPKAFNDEELIERLSDIINNGKSGSFQDENFGRYIFRPEKFLACDNILSILDNLEIQTQKNKFTASQYAHAIREYFRPKPLRKYSIAARRKLKQNNIKPKWPGLDYREINSFFSGFSKLSARFNDIKVANFERRMFMIYKS